MKQDIFKPYIRALEDIDQDVIREIALALQKAVDAGGAIFIAGNGGSGCIAQHLASDLMKPVGDNPDSKNCVAVSLSDNTAYLTAVANDVGYDKIFEWQAKCNHLGSLDSVITFSVSGNSQNICNLIGYARRERTYVAEIAGVFRKPLRESECINYDFLPIRVSATSTPEHYYVCESVFACVAHEIARQFHILRGNYSGEG
ncbi:MAG: SIS domain-containing protein [Candidatus Thorarchaeota archaeon]|jgi:phosphoheptose isomerase